MIKPYLDAGLELVTVAERVRGYFEHGEAKSQGTNGLLSRKSVAGLSKVWIGKESHPLADTEDLPDDETLEHYKAEAVILSQRLNHDLIAQAGIAEVAKAARVNEDILVDAIMSRKALEPETKERIAASLSIKPDGSIEIVKAPETRQELALARVARLLNKGKKLRELAQFINDEPKVRVSEMQGEQTSAITSGARTRVGVANGAVIEYSKILRDLIEISAYLSPPRYLPLTEIETLAKRFYGIEARLAKQAEKEKRQAELFKKTAHKARARRDKSRVNARLKEIERIAKFRNMPEILNAKDVKHAHLLDKELNRIAEDGFQPIRIVCSPHIKGSILADGLLQITETSGTGLIDVAACMADRTKYQVIEISELNSKQTQLRA